MSCIIQTDNKAWNKLINWTTMRVYVVNASSGEKSKSSQQNTFNQVKILNQLRFSMLTRSQDCVSHRGLVLHETPNSELPSLPHPALVRTLKSPASAHFLIHAFQLASLENQCITIGNIFDRPKASISIVMNAIWYHRLGEPFWSNCQVPGIVKNPVHLALVYVVVLKSTVSPLCCKASAQIRSCWDRFWILPSAWWCRQCCFL